MIWKKIEGYTNYYVSEIGTIKTTDYNHTGLEREVKVFKNCYGYMAVNLMEGGKRKRHQVHRLVASAFYPLSETCHDQVNHKDGDKTNNYYLNLEWCDAKHNLQHAFRTGLIVPKRGEDHYLAKLTNEEVREIIKLRNVGGMRLHKISELYGTSFKNISSIALGGSRRCNYPEKN